METSSRAAKRPRTGAKPTASPDQSTSDTSTLSHFLTHKRWDDAMECVHRGVVPTRPSALALACRGGAPASLIRTLLLAAPYSLRDLLDSRGTPLHEAISCDATSMDTLRALLQTDELLDEVFVVTSTSDDEEETSGSPQQQQQRAALMQDVDGFTPLHLLIRRRFQSHVLSETTSSLPIMLEALVKSCPESVTVPDRGEYEEPPIVYALKANIYAPGAEGDDHFVRVEAQIYHLVQTMLTHAPFAAAQSFRGFRGEYTALHSAVFHGRHTKTIELLLETERALQSQQQAALLTNTQEELPLHFCAMRGERPRTVALLAKNAPQAVLKRDSSGLTPFHWLWIRFVSKRLSLEEERGEERFDIPAGSEAQFELDAYNEFSILEQTDFEADLRLMRRLDPPVDFLRMRHIPEDTLEETDMAELVDEIKNVLDQIRTRFHQQKQQADTTTMSWTRIQAITALFWTKVVSMLRATRSQLPCLAADSGLVHTAFSSQCCPPPIARLVAGLFPQEIVTADSLGQLPIHLAAQRKFHAWDWLREDGQPQITAAGDLLRNESLQALREAIALSPREAMRVADASNRLVVHHVIETFIHACCQPARSSSDGAVEEIIRILRDLVSMYPECLSRRDGISKLHPFLQSVACATEQEDQMFVDEKNSLNITYVLLRENPAVMVALRQR